MNKIMMWCLAFGFTITSMLFCSMILPSGLDTDITQEYRNSQIATDQYQQQQAQALSFLYRTKNFCVRNPKSLDDLVDAICDSGKAIDEKK